MTRDLVCSEDISESMSYPFSFKNVQFQHDTYDGIDVALYYSVKAEMDYQGALTVNHLEHELELESKNFETVPPPVVTPLQAIEVLSGSH